MIVQGDGNIGRFAVWTGSDDAPWSDPQGNANRIKIHSDLDNAGIVDIRTGTLPTPVLGQTVLFGHGLDYAPLILGFVRINGIPVPINQAILVPFGSGFFSMTFGVNQSQVIINTIAMMPGSGAAPTMTYLIYLFDVGVSANGSFRRPAKFPGIGYDPVDGLSIGYISSKRRYLYRDAAGQIALPNGRTIATGVGQSQGMSTVGVGIRQSVNGHVVQRHAYSFGRFAGNSQTFNAATTKVAI